MSGSRGSSGDAKESTAALGSALAALIEKVHNPWIAAVLVVVLVAAIVVVFAFAGSTPAVVVFGIVALAAISFIGWTVREGHRVEATTAVDLNDTVAVAAGLSETARNDISRALAEASAETASLLGVTAESVRANLFGVSPDNKLSILPGLTHQMDRKEELELTLELGQGSTGVAFSNSRPNIAVLRTDWGKASLPDTLLNKVHPELCWIVSVPVFADPNRHPMWILNVDGLRQPANIGELQSVVGALVFYAQAVALIVAQDTSNRERS